MAYYNNLDQHVCGYKRDAMCVDVSVALNVYFDYCGSIEWM